MSQYDENQGSGGLYDAERRLRDERPIASDLELDRAKVRAMSASRVSGGRKRGFRPRVVSTLVATGLLALGAIGIGASSGGIPSVSFSSSATTSSANSQYCPPSAQGPPKPKNGENKCGQPKTK